mgnify:CR=1 FL=1
MSRLDVAFVNPNSSRAVYQGLADDYSAIETPTWSLLLAQSCRSKGNSVAILDADAERLSPSAAAQKIEELNPRLICIVVYGQNPNSGTTNMASASELAIELKRRGVKTPIGLIGSHVQALPLETLNRERAVDIGFLNEGAHSLWELLALDDIADARKRLDVPGLCVRDRGFARMTGAPKLVTQERMDIDLPGYAWDLLPYRARPLDMYRSHFWHAEYDNAKRTPFAALYTSLGCRFRCHFCMINVLNRNDEAEIGVASDYAGMRYWSPELIVNEFDKLVDMGVETLRISDEMFLLNRRYYAPLCEMLAQRGYGDKLRMWAYSRIDTINREEDLRLIRSAGIRWLALGIESANRTVRLEASKGKFKDVDIADVVRKVHAADIRVMANYMFGLPGDTYETMQQTLDLSLELCTLGWNAYAAMALPGSPLYRDAVASGVELPSSYEGYSFHSYDARPLPTETLTPADVLRFRDDAFHAYHSDSSFLERIEREFGPQARLNIERMIGIRLKRRLLEVST